MNQSTMLTNPDLRIIVFDFETGGLDCEKNPATELAVTALNTSTLTYQRVQSMFFKPYYNTELVYDQKALDKTGITLEMLYKSGKEPKEVMQMFIEVAEAANPTRQKKYKPMLGGHNLNFDIGFLAEIAAFTKTDLSKYLSGYHRKKEFIPDGIDTQKLAIINHVNDPDLVNHQLGTVAAHIGVDYSDGHRAAHDVIATADVLIYYFGLMRFGTGANNEMKKNNKKRHEIPL